MAKIAAVVTTRKEEVGGGAPIFIAHNSEDMRKIAFLLEKLLDCAAAEISETLFLIVDRHPQNG
jgi:Capping complex subunit for YIEGIA